MINSIYLENFKTHLSSSLDFSSGTNLIIGKVGSGKSSITDAICYALYGTFPSLSNKKLKTIDVIMFKPVKKENAKIILTLTIDSKIYKIEREINDKGITSAKLYLDNKLIAGPKQTDVTTRIEELLGVDYELFTKIVYSEQNELDYFLKIQPSKRKEKFDDLFGIIKLDTIKDGARTLDRLVDVEMSTTTQLISQISSQLTSFDLETKLLEQKETKDIQNKLKEELLLGKGKEDKLTLELANQKKKKQDFDLRTKELIFKKVKLEDINNYLNLNKLDEKYISYNTQDIEKEKLILSKDLESTKDELNKKSKLVNERISFERELSRLEAEIKEKQQRILDTKTKLSATPLHETILTKKSIEEQLSLIKQKRITSLSIISELEKSISELKKGFSKCPICDNQLSKEDIQKKQLSKEEELKTNKQYLEVTTKEIDKLKQDEEKIDKQISKQKEDDLALIQLEITTTQHQKRKEEIQVEIQKLTTSITEIKEDDSYLQKINDNLKQIDLSIMILEKMNTKENLKNEILAIEESLKQISYNEEEYIKINSTYLTLENEIKSLTARISSSNSLLDNLEKQITNYNQLESKRKDLESTKENYLIKKQDLSNFIKSIEVSQHQLRKVLIDNINDALSIIWPKVYPYKDYLSARLRSDNDYILEVQTKSKEWIKVEGFLSGGERACAALSIRIAIALILTKNLGLLILDEPTHNLDTKAVEMLSQVLEDDIPQYIAQVFIITHDTKLLETLNSHKYIIERDKENDGISEINMQ
ncbi:MAG: SMC family ATPase [archaeon]